MFWNHIQHLIHQWSELSLPLRWAGTGFVLLFFELNTERALAILFAGAAFATVVPALILPPETLGYQVIFFLLVSSIAIYNRPRLLKLYVGDRNLHPEMTERVLGRPAVCTKPIEGHLKSGTVRVAGHEWPALAVGGHRVAADEPVRVIGRRDGSLLVDVDEIGKSTVLDAVPKLTGRRGVWTGPGAVALAKKEWPARPWPPGTPLEPGRPVTVLGGNSMTLFVEPERAPGHHQEAVAGVEATHNAVGICKETVRGLTEPGTVLHNGILWRARADRTTEIIAKGESVRVLERDGAVLIVGRADTAEAPAEIAGRDRAPEIRYREPGRPLT